MNKNIWNLISVPSLHPWQSVMQTIANCLNQELGGILDYSDFYYER